MAFGADIIGPMSPPLPPEVIAGTSLPAATEVDLLAVPVLGNPDTDSLDDLPGLDRAVGGAVARARASGEFRAKRHETCVVHLHGDAWKTLRVVLVGAPAATAGTTHANASEADRLRDAAAVAGRLARACRLGRVAFVCRGPGDRAALAQAASEGLVLGSYCDTRYKSEADPAGGANGSDPGDGPPACTVLQSDGMRGDQLRDAVRRGAVLGEATNVARRLANEPSNILTPHVFAEEAVAAVESSGISTEVLDEHAIADLGMGLFLGVAQGSREPPRLLVMRYDPPGAPPSPLLALVGKGVTFDSGGISIKPAGGMEWMKSDMAGGAAVVGAMRAIGRLGARRRVLGVVPMTENMPGGRAIRPGDILTGASGTTVEVINTDAEGRLILGDAIWYARQQGATHLIDVATLTGSCVVALGHATSGLFGRPDAWSAAVRRAAARAGEAVWPMPLYEEYREQLRSEMADLMNVGGRSAGACTAASFLEAFTDGLPWAHLDIAGTAWHERARDDAAAGATGVMVRTLATLANDNGSWEA